MVNEIEDMTDEVVGLTNDIIENIKMLKVLAPLAIGEKCAGGYGQHVVFACHEL